MIVLGIDPGTATTGYGVLKSEIGRLEHITHGTILTSKNDQLPMRYLSLYDQLCALIKEHSPDVIATEKLFFTKNVNTGISVGGSIGVILLACAQNAIPWVEYRPAEVKLAVVGYGAAEKHQVQYMVKHLLGLTDSPTPDDAADGLAIAICHAHSSIHRK